jgi:hypothetical protein
MQYLELIEVKRQILGQVDSLQRVHLRDWLDALFQADVCKAGASAFCKTRMRASSF